MKKGIALVELAVLVGLAGFTFLNENESVKWHRQSAFCRAAANGNLWEMRLWNFLNTGINDQIPGSGPVLIAAAGGGHIEAVRWLLERGANPNVHDKFGWTPLIAAAGNGHKDVIELLIVYKADLNYASSDGTAMRVAGDHGQFEVFQQLARHGALDCNSDHRCR